MGARETWRQCFCKFVMKVTVTEATHTCKYGHIWSGLKAGSDEEVQGVQHIWDANSTKAYWGFLLIDEKNAFNKISSIGMLWRIRHLWPSGAHFVLNFYRNWSSIYLQNGDRTANTIHSREGGMQGDPLDMVNCGIRALPLIKWPKLAYPDVTQPWYADNSGALGRFDNV